MEGRKNLVRCAPVERKAVVQLCAAACGGNVARMSARGQEPGEGIRAEAKRVDAAPGAERGLGHPERFCPSCSAELKESGCKLSYPRCGFYLRGADIY
jgi:hypothetical protein